MGKECWLVQNYKEKGAIGLLVSDGESSVILTKTDSFSWDMNENINKENKKNSGFGTLQ